MTMKKKNHRERLAIAGDIFKVLEKKLAKKEERKLLEPLFLEMTECEQRQFKYNERARLKAAKLPQVCSYYEIIHGRGCGTCAECKESLKTGETLWDGKPLRFLNDKPVRTVTA